MRPGWQQFSLTMVPQAAYAAPFFRLFDENSVGGDSRLVLTDVSLQAELIPEPGAIALCIGMLALAGVLIRRRTRLT
jgi:uncharacterized protein (TIGR03382 family)